MAVSVLFSAALSLIVLTGYTVNDKISPQAALRFTILEVWITVIAWV